MAPEIATGCWGTRGPEILLTKVVVTTGLTHGICHAVQMCVLGEHIRYDRRGKCFRVREREVRSQWNGNDWSGAR